MGTVGGSGGGGSCCTAGSGMAVAPWGCLGALSRMDLLSTRLLSRSHWVLQAMCTVACQQAALAVWRLAGAFAWGLLARAGNAAGSAQGTVRH